MKVAISLTVHERLDVLVDQIRNIITFFIDPIVVVHINDAFYQMLIEDLSANKLLKELALKGPVIINPAHLPTRWAHMFHAHVSNINLLSRFSIPYEYVILLSSSDIMIRHGVETFLKDFDYGIDGAVSDIGSDFWISRVELDHTFLEIRRKNNVRKIKKALHEGTFYKYAVMMSLIAKLEEAIPDWEYDDKYPKEEFFLPSLVSADDRLSCGGSMSYALGFDIALDRVMISTFLRNNLLDKQVLNPLLCEWVEESLRSYSASLDGLTSKFSVSRVVRDSGHPLRMLLLDGSQSPYHERAKYIASRLTLDDLLMIDYPARVSYAASSRSAVLNKKIRALPAGNVRWSAERFTGCQPVEIVLSACRGTFAVPVPIWPEAVDRDAAIEQFQICAANLDGQIDATISLTDDCLLLERSSEILTPVASHDKSFLFMFFQLRQDPPISVCGVIVKSSWATATPSKVTTPDTVWLEFHSDEAKTKLLMRRDEDHALGSTSKWYLDDDDRERVHEARTRAGSFLLYLGYGLTKSAISLADVSFFE